MAKELVFKSMPLSRSMAMRLHECGSDEDQERLVYVLAVCLDERERWLCQGLKKPSEMARWAMAGFDRWGLAEEFEPMRRLARCKAMGKLLDVSRGRVNESLASRVGHLRAIALIPPRLDHVFWAIFLGVSAFLAWMGGVAGSWAGSTHGAMGLWGVWGGTAALFAAMLKGAVYVWQDSSSSMAEGIQALGWGRDPRESAISALAAAHGVQEGEAVEPRAPPELERKARRGRLSPMEALTMSRVSQSAKAWRDDWSRVEERLERDGATAINDSKQQGWALARIEAMEIGAGVDAGHEAKPSKKRL